MPKRPLESAAVPTMAGDNKAQKKTERSHEENQERAYIAASRRADRSIEARVQSARMASEIHKKRTGKGFKISEEIVVKEEMYEEDDDDLPRHYRLLAAHLQTSSADMNSRLSAYITNQVAMASLARQQEVNRMFAEQFPNANQISQQLAQSMYFQPLQNNQTGSDFHNSPASPTSPTFHHSRSQSMSQAPIASPEPQASPPHRHLSLDGQLSPPALTPGSASTETPQSHSTPRFGHASSFDPAHISMSGPIDPALASYQPQHGQTSSFTSELPPETKLLANLDMSDPLSGALFGQYGEMTSHDGAEVSPCTTSMPFTTSTPAFATKDHVYRASMDTTSYFTQGLHPPSRIIDIPGDGSRIGTPGGGDGDSWDAWVNTEDWANLGSAPAPH